MATIFKLREYRKITEEDTKDWMSTVDFHVDMKMGVFKNNTSYQKKLYNITPITPQTSPSDKNMFVSLRMLTEHLIDEGNFFDDKPGDYFAAGHSRRGWVYVTQHNQSIFKGIITMYMMTKYEYNQLYLINERDGLFKIKPVIFDRLVIRDT